MGFQKLSEEDKDVVHRALRAVHDGPLLDEADFQPRLGVGRERLTEMLTNWPVVVDGDTDADEAILINNALNEIANGVSLSADEWTRWFGSLPRRRVRDVLQRWRQGEEVT